MASHDTYDSLLQRSRLKRYDRHIVRHQLAPHRRIAQRHLTEYLLYLGHHLRAVAVELTACRGRIEEVAHHKLRTYGAHRRALRDELSAIYDCLRTHLILRSARAQLNLRHCRNRGQRLAAKAKGLQTIYIVKVAYLTRGVAIEGHTRIEWRHTATVIYDLYELQPRIAEIHGQRGRSGVDRVLHHLLYGRCRIIHHLASRNLIGHDFG